MKKMILLAGLVTVFLAGCNTVSGVGKDVSAGGRAVSNAAENVKDSM